MLKKPVDWDTIVPAEYGGYETLELGGHEIVIKKAYEYTGKNGNTSLKIEVDIAGNDKQAGFYQKQFESNSDMNKSWPNGACRYISLKDDQKCKELFKGFTTLIENSNPGYKWNFDETTLVGKKLCGVFGLEEFEKQDGKVGMATKLVQLRSLDKLKEVQIPKVKLLDETFVDYEEYRKNRENSNNTVKSNNNEVINLDSSFLD